MSDNEWAQWQGLWKEKQDALPEMRRFSSKLNRRLWVSNLIFWPIALGESVFWVHSLVYGLAHPGEPWAILDGVLLLGVMVAMSVWYVRGQRRVWQDALETPEEMLERFERHARFGRRAAWIGSGMYLAISALAWCQAAWEARGAADFWAQTRLGALLTLSGVFLVAVYPRLIGRVMDRQQARIEAWRKQLGERSNNVG